jgi:putative nucleotidyltransferase with HDIG domain
MDESQVYSKVERENKLFTLPEVLAQVLQVAEDNNASIGSIAEVVSKDFALTGKLLRVANSSFYGRASEVRSMDEAVNILGTRTVKAIALSVSVYDMCNRLKTRLDMKDFWRHSLEIAVLSEHIAKAVKYSHPEEAFVAGLLLDIGIPVLDAAFPDEYEQVWQHIQKGKDLLRVEESFLGTNHARVGAFLLSKWSFPKLYVECVEDHHRTYEAAEASDTGELIRIVGLASRIAKFSMYGPIYSGVKDFDTRNALLESFGLSHSELAEIDSKSMKEFMDTAKLLEIDIGSPLDLVQQANYKLYRLFREYEYLYRRLETREDDLPKDRVDEIAIDVMFTVVATFSHYFNNACATILGRSQLIELALKKGEISDSRGGTLNHSIEVIQRGVESITNVLCVMKSVESFHTIQYHESAKIIDLKNHLEKLAARELETIEQV